MHPYISLFTEEPAINHPRSQSALLLIPHHNKTVSFRKKPPRQPQNTAEAIISLPADFSAVLLHHPNGT